MRRQILLCMVAWLAGASLCFAKKPASTRPTTLPSEPQQTFVGFYINDIYGLDLKASTYTVDFYIWFRWQGPRPNDKGLDPNGLDPSEFEFLNGQLDLKEHEYRIDVGNTHYVSFHCRGIFHIAFDYRRYPLDEHELVLEMEDAVYEDDQMRYVVDTDNMRNLKPVVLSGWDTGDQQFEVERHLYQTTFGEPTEITGGTSVYSRLVCSVHISRHFASVYLKIFLGLFISVGIAFLAFLLKPSETDPRFALGVAAIFGAVSSEIVATGNLPDMPYLTMVDKLHLFSLFIIFLSLLQSCLMVRLRDEDKAALALRVNRISLIGFPLSYAVVVLVMTLHP